MIEALYPVEADAPFFEGTCSVKDKIKSVAQAENIPLDFENVDLISLESVFDIFTEKHIDVIAKFFDFIERMD